MDPTFAMNDCYAACQGEGALTGQAMALLRLHGCPVGCPFCDTKETWHARESDRRPTLAEALGTNPLWAEVAPADLVAYLRREMPQMPWVLLTGGEPALQPLGPLVRALRAAGFKVALETSGTADGHMGVTLDWVCVSPKIAMPGGLAVIPRVLAAADELKFVIGKPADLDRADACLAALDHPGVFRRYGQTISLQPVSANPRATALCLETVKARGWRLSVQVHKLLGER